jgi:hypothetical protein
VSWVLLLVALAVFALLDLVVMAVDGPEGHYFIYPFLVLAVAIPFGYLGRRWRVKDPHDDRALFEFDLDHGETKQPDDKPVDRPESDD